MGDLLDDILAEIKAEKRTKNKELHKERWKRNNAERHRKLVAAKIRLAKAVGDVLKKNPRDAFGRCVFCESSVPKRHRKGCKWLELYIEYSTYKNKYLSGKVNK